MKANLTDQEWYLLSFWWKRHLDGEVFNRDIFRNDLLRCNVFTKRQLQRATINYEDMALVVAETSNLRRKMAKAKGKESRLLAYIRETSHGHGRHDLHTDRNGTNQTLQGVVP